MLSCTVERCQLHFSANTIWRILWAVNWSSVMSVFCVRVCGCACPFVCVCVSGLYRDVLDIRLSGLHSSPQLHISKQTQTEQLLPFPNPSNIDARLQCCCAFTRTWIIFTAIFAIGFYTIEMSKQKWLTVQRNMKPSGRWRYCVILLSICSCGYPE